MGFDADPQEAIATLYEEIGALYPDYKLLIVRDVDLTD